MNPKGVYDDQQDDPESSLPHLRSLENRGVTPQPGARGTAPTAPGEESLFSPNDSAGESTAGESIGSGGLGSTRGGASGTAGSQTPTPKLTKRLRSFASVHRRKIIGGGGAVGGITTLLITMFLMLIPLKIEHMISNLENRFFASTENAISNSSDHLMAGYYGHILPQYKNCGGSTINRHCKVSIAARGNNPVSNLYHNMAGAKIENHLADKGIEFKFDRHSNAWYLKAPGTNSQGDRVGVDGPNLDKDIEHEFQRSDRKAMRAFAHKAFDDETFLKKVHGRYKIGVLMERKYGIKRCIVFCGTRDSLADNLDSQKKAAKLYLLDRVLEERKSTTVLAVRCLLDDNCHPDETEPNKSGDPAARESGGTPASDFEVEGRTTLGQRAASLGLADSKALNERYDNMAKKGLQNALIEDVLTKLLGAEAGEVASKGVTKAIPIIGWADLAARGINAANDAGPKLKKIAYVTNAATAVSMFTMYQTYADEIHTGHVNATEVGSFTSSLNAPTKEDTNDTLVGGTASAEQSPLYGAYMNSDSSSSTALLENLLPGRALAASKSNSDSSYKCNNGKGVPFGELICPEEILGIGNSIANTAHDFLNIPGINVITAAAQVWRATVGQVFDLASGVISVAVKPIIAAANASCDVGISIGPIKVRPPSPLPGYCTVKSVVEDVAPKIIKGIVNELIPNPFGTNMSGGRKFDMIAAGANVSGNDACEQIGCKQATAAEAAVDESQYYNEDMTQFKQKPLYARLFDTSSDHSLATQVAMQLPSSSNVAVNSTMASIASPLSSIAKVFGSILSTPRTYAADGSDVTAFKLHKQVFPESDMPDDYEAYWDKYCSDNPGNGYQNDALANDETKGWNKAASKEHDEDTGMPVHKFTNACALIKHTVGDMGAKYDTSLLTEDEQNLGKGGSAPASGGGDSSSPGGSGKLQDGNAQDLAKQLLPFIKNGKIVCGSQAGGNGPADCQDIQNTANGKPIGGNCAVDSLEPHLLSLILGLVKDDGWKLGISAICSNHHVEKDGPFGGHTYGSVADFSIQNGATGAAAASNKKFVDDAAALLESTGGSFGQTQCHPHYSSLDNKKFTTFEDGCNHQHIRAKP